MLNYSNAESKSPSKSFSALLIAKISSLDMLDSILFNVVNFRFSN